MDIFPLPAEPIHPPNKIYLTSLGDYDNGPFLEYPERQGWGPRSLTEWQMIFTNPPRAFVAFLERWLLTGFISAVFESSIGTSEFINLENNASDPQLTMEPFRRLFQGAFEDILDLDRSLDVNQSKNTQEAYKYGPMIHSRLMGHQEWVSYSELRKFSGTVSLIKFLNVVKVCDDPRSSQVAMVTSAVMESYNLLFSWTKFESHEGGVHLGRGMSMDVRNSLLWTQLRADGWCPFELIPLFNAFNTPCLYFLRNLRRPSPHKSHQVIRIRSTQHSVNEDASNTPSAQLCSAFKCGQLNDDSYCTNHTGGCYDCQEIRADSEELCRILKDGKIPLILSLEENDKNGTIILVEADPSVSYVAISHVWSDGLGNTKRNGLPRCQLLRLSKMIRNLPGHHSDILHFWVDTICVPPNAARLEGAQLLALGLMPKTYEDATAVLVLDSWLLSSPCNGRSDIENIIRIFSSAWNSRLWTYQEGALAKVLYFQFEDTAYNLDEAARNMRKIEDAIQKVSVV
ncbi:hypothetical protein V491_03953 [Pseudogymnoascus sp. VKM F-3775]|nr:hypothetical protein V491_03953 [Pseudogymnoascus sp. VKM F-3775]